MADQMDKMLETLITEQRRLADSQGHIFSKIDSINNRLEDIIRIEERQANDRAALTRMGSEIDSLKKTVAAQAATITDLRIDSAKVMVKMTLLGGGGGSIVTIIVGGAIAWFTSGSPV